MAQGRILLITANLEASDIWNYALTRAGFDVFQFADAAAALAWRKENPSDVVLIAEDAAVLDGVALLQQLRPDVAAPILLATSGDTPRVLEAYRAGADECIGLPIYPELFIAKVKAWLRHSSTVPAALLNGLTRGPFELNPANQEITAHGRCVSLTNLEFRLLHLLIAHPNQVLLTSTLVDRVWGYPSGTEGKALKNLVYRLRRKIELDPLNPTYIVSVTGEGYMFKM